MLFCIILKHCHHFEHDVQLELVLQLGHDAQLERDALQGHAQPGLGVRQELGAQLELDVQQESDALLYAQQEYEAQLVHGPLLEPYALPYEHGHFHDHDL